MEVQVSSITRRKSGAIVSRDRSFSCEIMRFGRSTENEVQLSDPRVQLYQGTLHKRPAGLFFEAPSLAGVMSGGKLIRAVPVEVGSRLQLGPYEICIVEPPAGKDVAVTVELVSPLSEGIERLKARSCTTLADAGFGKRAPSWILVAAIIVPFALWPVGYHMRTAPAATTTGAAMKKSEEKRRAPALVPMWAWDSGEMSAPHKFIHDDCAVCHRRPFVMVEDRACVACHVDVRHHVDSARFRFPEVSEARCQSCHKEHMGILPMVRKDEAFCGACHGRLKELAKDSPFLNATDFGDNHPQFRPTVVVDAEADRRERMVLDPARWPVERSNLKFPHDKHLNPQGLRMPDRPERKVLACADCHRPEPGGVGMAAIVMEKHCMTCHLLRFEPAAPRRTLPHAEAAMVTESINQFYAEVALRGGADEFANAPPSVRRRPGAPLTEEARLEALAWAEQRSARTAEFVFTKGLCAGCHEVARADQGGRVGWTVKRVVLADQWLPKGRFDHGHHRTMACVDCHNAPTSQAATDVLLPGIESCQGCHGGEKATNRVPTTCVACHRFHAPHLGLMRPELARPPSR